MLMLSDNTKTIKFTKNLNFNNKTLIIIPNCLYWFVHFQYK